MNEAKEVGIASLVAKILCKRHNEGLSDVDSAAKQAFEVFQTFSLIRNEREGADPGDWNLISHVIDGPLLERWFLKTLINVAYRRGLPIGLESKHPGEPSESLVQIAFGQKPFESKAGLYFIVRVGMQFNSADGVSLVPLIARATHIVGGLFTFRGFHFLLYLEPTGPPQPLDGIFWANEDLGAADLKFHLQAIKHNDGGLESQAIRIRW